MIARLGIIAAACAAVLIGAIVEWRDHRTVDAQVLVNELESTAFVKGMPSNSVFLAPNLPAVPGKSFRVVRTGKEAFDAINQGLPVYYWERMWLPGRRAAVLLVCRLIASDAFPIECDKVTMAASREWQHMALQYQSTAPGQGPAVSETRVKTWRRDRSVYLADLPTPGWRPGGNRLVDDEGGVPQQVAVTLDFGKGFAEVTEHAGGHYYRWTDSKNGQAEFNLVNAMSKPLAVRFRGGLRFDSSRKTGSFDLTAPSGTEAIHIENGGLLERVWTLQPGANRIVLDCHEPRINTPGDIRGIYFGLWDWTVLPAAALDTTQ